MTLRDKIVEEIRERGPIPFSRYMELCLYDPELGYYSRHAGQFGKAGDFYTSSDVHAVFGRLLARQFDEMWRLLGAPPESELVELGPGRGLFAQDVLDWSETHFPEFFQCVRYRLVETSPALCAKLRETLSERFASGKVSFLTTLAPENPAIVLANEFFDALPVEVVGFQGSLRIDASGGQFVETWTTPSAEEHEFLDRYSVHPQPGERVEVPLIAQNYAKEIATRLNCGFVVIIDYGYTREEQLAGRHRDTVTAIRQHSVSDNAYEAPGEQDITAHVNFTALAATMEQHGAPSQKLVTQSQFLLGIGEENQFADVFAECRVPQERAKVSLQLKHLITPSGMGENFHVLIASKGVGMEKAASVSGLGFANPKSRI